MQKDRKIYTYEEALKNEKTASMLEKSKKKQKRKERAGKTAAVVCFTAAAAAVIIYYICRSVRASNQLKIIAGDFMKNPAETTVIILIAVIVTLILYKAKSGTEEKYKKLMEEKTNGKNSDENSAR